MVLVNDTKFILFFQRELPRRSVCHSFTYLLSNSLSTLSLGSSRLKKKKTLHYISQASLPAGIWKCLVKRRNWFLSFSCLPWLPLAESCSFPIQSVLPSVLPGPWAASYYALTLTKWPCHLDTRNIVFQPQGLWLFCCC